MDFFKSVFSEDPDPPKPDPSSSQIENQRGSDSSGSDPDTSTKPHESIDPETQSESTSRWAGFGGLIRTLAVKSESVIETYRRDLHEFGTGLKKEIEVAQGSLETVSHAIDEIGSNVIKGTAQIISQGKDSILSADPESDSSDGTHNRISDSKRYSRFDSQVRVIQSDVSTYCEEPEDLGDYSNWKSVFGLEEKEEEIGSLMKENEAMVSVYKRVVPGSVDHQTFWFRYFYKVHKLKQTDNFRAKLVNRAISPEEELSWDFDDSDDEKKKNHGKDHLASKEKSQIGSDKVEGISNIDVQLEPDQPEKKDNVDEASNIGSSKVVDESSLGRKEDVESKPEEKVTILEEKTDHGRESSKGSDYSMVSSQPSMAEEEDLGWDEIEDLSSIDDDKKTARGDIPSRADLHKRLSVAEEEEDLSWDIEDDDDHHVKG